MKKLLKLKQYIGYFMAKAKSEGFANAVRFSMGYLSRQSSDMRPLSFANQELIFQVNRDIIKKRQKQQMRGTSLLFDASQVESTYPEVFQWEDRAMRYAYLPSKKESRGLVVYFHGHNAYLHLGPVSAWDHYDILAPWDNYGWNRQGSWFWGEKGDNFVERMVFDLIKKVRSRYSEKPWFCMGSSMGGFASLMYGIKYDADGIYSMSPQIDLRKKIEDYGIDNQDNPYGYLRNDSVESVADLFSIAEDKEELAPAFITQHQFDGVNLFAEHGYKLLDVYNKKNAWYSVRVIPAIGHESDGSQREAEMFFDLINERKPPKKYIPR
jgi:hypothetical protein